MKSVRSAGYGVALACGNSFPVIAIGRPARWRKALSDCSHSSVRSCENNLCSANNPCASRFEFNLTLQFSPVDIRDADHPEQGFLQLGDHTEYGNLKCVAPECLVRAQECLVPGWSVGGLGCNELPTP